MTKEAAGIYSTERPSEFVPVEAPAYQTELMEIDPEPGEGVLESYTVVHGREGPKQGIAFGRTDKGRRFLGKCRRRRSCAAARRCKSDWPESQCCHRS